MSNPFLDAISQKPLLGDGGIGTLLYSRGSLPSACFEQLNLTNKDMVQQVHVDYLTAGADIIETNSFSGNRMKLAAFGLENEVWNINVWAAKIARNAREIAGNPAFIAGAVGPTGKMLPPLGTTEKQELYDAFREQMEGLLAGGVDLFMIETMSSLDELVQAVRAARSLSKLPIVAQVSFSPEGFTLFGATPEDTLRIFDQLGADMPEIFGINCGAGPGPVFDAFLRMKAALDNGGVGQQLAGFSALPNAGQPSLTGGRTIFMSRPDYCASYVEPFVMAGAKIIGGCCGTTPDHIKAMRKSLDAFVRVNNDVGTATLTELPSLKSPEVLIAASPMKNRLSLDTTGGTAPEEATETAAAPERPLKDRLKAFKDGTEQGFFVSVEIDPPKGAVTKKLIKAAKMLKESGADSINVGDSPMARVRMSSLATCKLIGTDTGIETIIHFTTRDRNLMGIQADLLGCQALGVHNILALTGDPPALGNYAHATAVYDVDSVGLIRIISQLNEGKDIAGNTIGSPTNLSIGCALNCTHEERALEKERFKRKLEAGAHFVMTQPIYQVNDLTDFLDEYGECPVPILVGIMPLHSSKHAEYLHNEVPGITIPSKIRQAMAKAGDQGAVVGLELAQALLEQLRGLCQGTYLVPSFGRYDDMCTLVTRLKQKLVSTK